MKTTELNKEKTYPLRNIAAQEYEFYLQSPVQMTWGSAFETIWQIIELDDNHLYALLNFEYWSAEKIGQNTVDLLYSESTDLHFKLYGERFYELEHMFASLIWPIKQNKDLQEALGIYIGASLRQLDASRLDQVKSIIEEVK